MSKRRFIKDPIWGNVELFKWESELLGHYLINRLHDVIQNSCAYKVYPGLNYSRFVHSIGILHVSSEIFLNVIINSSRELIGKLDAETDKILNNFSDSDIDEDKYVAEITERTRCPKRFALHFATIRTSALLHDLGHLPYSHIFEFALERFVSMDLDDDKNLLNFYDVDDNYITEAHKKLSNVLEPPNKGELSKPHEILGEKFMEHLTTDEENEDDKEDYSPFVDGAIQLWRHDSLPITKSLLSASVDADRIDFVRRDGWASGLYVSSIDFDRLFSFYELAEDEEGTIKARPSRRAAAEAEKLLWHRFMDYKYIISHHKVHMFDEILERIIFYLLVKGELKDILNPLEIISDSEEEQNPQTLRGQKNVYKKRLKRAESRRDVLTRFNDSWLNTKINNVFNENDSDDNKIPERMAKLYNTFVEKRSLFKSMFKRDEDFFKKMDIDESIMSISFELSDQKYEWEQELSEKCNVPILLGDLTNKIRSGIKGKKAANFFGLTKVESLIKDKMESSRPFNIWYHRYEEDKKDETIEEEIIEFINDKVSNM